MSRSMDPPSTSRNRIGGHPTGRPGGAQGEKTIGYLNAHGGELDLGAALSALRRRKGVILVTCVVITALTVVTAMQIKPRYTGTSSVMIQVAESPAVDLNRAASSLPHPSLETAIATHIGLLRSPSLAKRVVADLRLDRRPDYNPPLAATDRWVAGGFWQELVNKGLTATGFAQQPSHLEAPATGTSGVLHAFSASEPERASELPQSVIDEFLDRLSVKQDGESQLVTVSFTSTDPTEAALITNTVVDFYIQSRLQEKLRVASQAAKLVSDRVEQLREGVLQAEAAIGDYRAASGLMDTREGSLDAQQLASVRQELSIAQAERTAKEARLNQARALNAAGGSYESLSEVGTSSVIADLRRQQAQLQRAEAQLAQTYGGRHPRIVELRAERENISARIAQEITNVIRSLENEVEVARIREDALQRTFAEAKEQYATSGKATVQLHELERAATAKRLLYETFLARSKELTEQQGLLVPDAEVVHRAEPPDQPSFPKVGTVAIIGFLGSVVLGTALAALMEHLDRGLRSGRQVEQVLGVPSLGLVPDVGRSARRRPLHCYLLDRPLSTYADAIRAIQTAVQHFQHNVSPQVILVTSALPDEGKTSVAVSLAVSFARSGHRTLLLDLDLRRPTVARKLGHQPETGIVEHVLGDCGLDDVLRVLPGQSALHFIPVNYRTSNPPDLIGSQKMKILLAELRGRYDYIILDSPPALGPTDARLTALLADVAIFVVRWGTTGRTAAANGLDSLAKSEIPIAGAILNRVDLRKHASYDYDDIGEYYLRIK